MEPDYKKAQEEAYKIVQICGQKKLPLSIKKIIKSFPNLRLRSYSKLAKKRNLTLEEVSILLDSDEGCLWSRNNTEFLILYNDQVPNKGRIRFTLAHELGHYILKHNEKTEKTKLTRYSLTQDEYDVFEKEANYFAKRLLAPIPLVYNYYINWKDIASETIQDIFKTSLTVANFIIKDIQKVEKNGVFQFTNTYHPMLQNFKTSIELDTHSKICFYCHSLNGKENSFCKVCAGKKFILPNPKKYNAFLKEKSKMITYSKIELNENLHPFECPRCHGKCDNENFIFCPYCSLLLRNYCLGLDNDRFIENEFEDYVEKPLIEQVKSGCGITHNGDARYCTNCGEETAYLRQGILSSWKEEFHSREFNSVGSDLPF